MFKPSKMGLFNFWLYDEEEYEFFDEKLLLRGRNGSGKSVTMQSFIPLILDGNKTPKRLDTFGGTDKHIEYYILGDDKQSSIGYLYMEFFDEEKDKYITIGMGLSAKVGRPTDFFGFALKDGKRIHHGFELYKLKDGFNKTPLTKTELKIALAPDNIFVETAKDYKKMVNNLLYGFENIDSFDEFISVLLQIRSPKLSKEYKPTDLMNTLNEVLPPLTEEDLLPLSETIESLNSTKEIMEDLNNKIKELTNYLKVYNNYNETILYNKAQKYNLALSKYQALNKDRDLNLKTIKELEKNIESTRNEISNLNISYEKALKTKENINNSDIESKTKRLVELESEIVSLEQKITKETNILEDLNTKLKDLENKQSNLEDINYNLDKEIKNDLMELEALCEEIHFDNLRNYLSILLTGEIKNLDTIEELIKDKKKSVEIVKNILNKKDNLDNTLNEKTIEYDKLTSDYQELSNKLEEKEDQKELYKDEFIDEIIKNNKNHSQLKLEENDLKEIFVCLKDFSIDSYNEAKKKYLNYYQIFLSNITSKKATLESHKEELNNNLIKEQGILEELKQVKELELAATPLEQDTNKLLRDLKIKYLPFYKAIDFKDNLKEEIKNKLEAQILSSGLLNAKIINTSDESKIKNINITYLIPGSKKKNNLTKYFIPAKNDLFNNDYITKILESISIDSSDSVYLNEESYRFEFLKGTNSIYESKYIGFQKRIEEHQNQILAQTKKITEIENKISSIKSLIDKESENISILNTELEDFPSIKNLEEITKEIEMIHLKIENNIEQRESAEKVINELNQKLKELIKELNNYKDLGIPLNIGAINNALGVITKIDSDMNTINKNLNSLAANKELIKTNNKYLESTKENYDNVFSDLSLDKDLVVNKKNESNSINEILNTKEYQELSKKLKEVEEIINKYPKTNSTLERTLGSITKDLEQKQFEQVELTKRLEMDNQYLDIYYNILNEELNLGYVLKDFVLTKDNAIDVLKYFKDTISRDIATANSNYYRGFNTYRQELMEYSLNDVCLFNKNELVIESYIDKGLDKEKLEKIYSEAVRQDITATYQSKKVSLYSLLESLKDNYETNKVYLSEKDRHLFEDILLRTIGGKIKTRINEAKDWVKKMNEIMTEKQKNSNLCFFLSWLSKSRESLEEMDTKELVEIFKMDPDMLRPQVVENLIKHFRAKIARAEETMNDLKESYFDIIFKILDYRNWFEFKLYYKRKGEDKRELTNKIFSVFSGGEKAKTMYIPLFACACAKLSSAQNFAPRLIALDEAFAGVDDENIEEMFGILSSFNLDYILTSQSLWCDYSSVKDISINELISDAESKTIGVKRYRWNGTSRISLDEE